ncbi:Thromboxane-A synthase [Dorcoceras hygrometricum]|uniref:Thromboxane-A synthase n=1 Tax=Dorcoceras hygrometricum TaxID=472368 RepID=A0A2Z7CZ76_9LAMI|nr:Thromboxane-A synthase [Dorcoceras hygrometricum]
MHTSSNLFAKPDFVKRRRKGLLATTKSLKNNAYVIPTTPTRDADVIRSTNRFSPTTHTSNAYVIHAKQPRNADVIKSANRFTERSLNSNAYVSQTTTTHAADVMKSATKFHPKFENLEISRIGPNVILYPKMQPNIQNEI